MTATQTKAVALKKIAMHIFGVAETEFKTKKDHACDARAAIAHIWAEYGYSRKPLMGLGVFPKTKLPRNFEEKRHLVRSHWNGSYFGRYCQVRGLFKTWVDSPQKAGLMALIEEINYTK